jgi:hypothetical protein
MLPILALMTLAVIGCSGVEVSQDYKTDADFSGISLFAWATDTQEKTGDVRADNPLLNDRIRDAVEQTLKNMGLSPADRPAADVLVEYQLQIRQKIRSDDVRGGVGFGYGSYGRVGGIAIGTGGDVQSYDEGLLVIDLIRTDSETLLWRGNATFPMPDHMTPEKTTAQIQEAVEKTLAQFPPAPEKVKK